MCGIFGFFGKVKEGKGAEVKCLLDALGVYSQRRGMDGSGYFLLTGRDFVDKKNALPWAYFRTTFMEDVSVDNISAARVFIGHVRAGSFGGVNDDACHPFVGNRYAMVHNGTSFEALGMANDAGIQLEYGTDSEAIHKLMEMNGADESLFSKLSCYSIVFFDKDTGKIHFVRDHERMMAIFDLRETHGIRVFASEKRIVKKALEYVGIEVKPGSFFTVAHKMYTGDLDGEVESDEEFEDDRYQIDLNGEGYPAYPLLDSKAKVSKDMAIALMKFKKKKPFQMDRPVRLEAMKELLGDLATGSGIMTSAPELVDLGEDQTSNGGADRLNNKIYLSGNLSIITLLHEFGHLLYGSSERRAVYFSVNLFRKVFTKQFSGLRTEGHKLVRVRSD